MWAVFKKELKTYFLSPIGYIAVGLFLFIFSIVFWAITRDYGIVNSRDLYSLTAVYGLSLLIPILTMRMFAEERKNGTEQLLLTSPRNVTAIVLGKYLAVMLIVLITILISFIYVIIVSFLGEINIVMVLVMMLGFLLLAMAQIAFGMFVSSITENQIIAAIISMVFFIMPLFIQNTSISFSSINLIGKFTKFLYELISITDVIGLMSFTAMFIAFTILCIKKRKTVK